MSFVFQRTVDKLGIGLAQGNYGWHAIRRALATELLYTDVSLINLVRFMRWSDGSVKGEFGMLAIYGERNQEEVDRSVFAVHPLLPIWSEGGEQLRKAIASRSRRRAASRSSRLANVLVGELVQVITGGLRLAIVLLSHSPKHILLVYRGG